MIAFVEEFNVGDKIRLYGYTGTVKNVRSCLVQEEPCTYLTIKFDAGQDLCNTSFDMGQYGGKNGSVSYWKEVERPIGEEVACRG